ncbi:MAG: 50S ribosomal protein L11 methyltransferase [Oscillospiraceae bacterium]|nr:50S ribosomal protein L11 methyltransferase [Oscillospiraceae bacterium]
MEWIQVAIDTTHDGVEALTSSLEDIGIRGFEIEDSADFDEFLHSEFPYRDYVDAELIDEKLSADVKVKIYVSANDAGREQLLAVEALLDNLRENEEFGSLRLSFVTMNEEDWSENWKQFFHPLKIGRRVLVRPEWEECENDDGRVVFTINPGMSFGTGSHATTQLCLEAIEEYTKDGDTILDLGCGSGILSITACLLGAKHATAMDIDKNAVDIALRNAELNGVSSAKYEAMSGNILDDAALRERFSTEKYDIVAANIVSDVIIGIAPFVADFVREGGIFIASGIITDRLDEVLGYIEQNFEIIRICDKNDWASIIARPKKK